MTTFHHASKYRAVRTEVDGVKFASKHEAACYQKLKLLEKAGKISCLELQVPFPLIVNGVTVGKYIADFVYHENGERVIADAKGFKTPTYRLKAKMMKAQYGQEIKEL